MKYLQNSDKISEILIENIVSFVYTVFMGIK